MPKKILQIADLSRRFAAATIDLLTTQFLMYLLFKLFDFLCKASKYEYLTDSDDNVYFGLAFVISYLIVLIIYFAVQHSSMTQATLGKNIVGIEVVDMEGQAITKGTSYKRALIKVLSYALFFISGPLIIFDSYGRSLEDRLAKTYVVRKKGILK